jgi:hypothetical protein
LFLGTWKSLVISLHLLFASIWWYSHGRDPIHVGTFDPTLSPFNVFILGMKGGHGQNKALDANIARCLHSTWIDMLSNHCLPTLVDSTQLKIVLIIWLSTYGTSSFKITKVK